MLSGKTRGVYVLSNEVWTPPDDLALSVQATAEVLSTVLDEQSLDTTTTMLASLPLSDRTYLPAGYHQVPIQLSIDAARDEIGHTFEEAVKPALVKLGYKGKDVTVVVTGCTTYSSVPPQSARLCNILGCNSDVTGINLSGTGDSLAVTALTTAASMLRARPEPGVAVVALSETMSTLLYGGRDERFLASNTSKRLGCACIILSTYRRDKTRSKYKVCEDASTCKYLGEGEIIESFELDRDGVFGFRRNDAFAYEDNLVRQVKATYAALDHHMIGTNGCHVILQPSHPDLIKLGYKALDIGDDLDEQESSMNAYHRFGDVGPAACWYGLAHREASSGVQKGARVMLIAVSSNLYTSALVLEARRDIRGRWDAQASPDRVKEAFKRYHAGIQPERAMLMVLSKRDDIVSGLQHTMFYPYTHGIWSSDMTRFKSALKKLEPLYRKIEAEDETKADDAMQVAVPVEA